RRKLRRTICLTLAVSLSDAPAPEIDLECLIELAQRRVKMEALAASLPSSAPWRGLTTEISASKKALDAGRRLREAVVRLSAFTGEPDHTLASAAPALCAPRESL